jgi:hypothetical protein
MSWLKQLFSRRRRYSDLSKEIQEHLEEKIGTCRLGSCAHFVQAIAFLLPRRYQPSLQDEKAG